MTQPHSLELVKELRLRAKLGNSASQLLRFLALERGIEQQVVWMELFAEAFQVNLGAITAIGAWWYEGDAELSDSSLDAYIQYIIDDYLAGLSKSV